VTLLAGLLATVLVFSVLRERDAGFRATAAGAEIRAGTAVEAGALRVVDVRVPDDVRGRLVDRPRSTASAAGSPPAPSSRASC